jgi:catechol 2,3-dioxygenase-like lactoylglutathione lyase family enzyme
VDMKLEVVTVPVTDIDRAAQFYKDLGWRLDADLGSGNSRVVQLTPPGSPCSVHLRLDGAHRRFLVVSDVEAARDELVAAGVAVGEYSHTSARTASARGWTRSGAATGPTPRSPTPTATSGCSRRSPSGCPAADRPGQEEL